MKKIGIVLAALAAVGIAFADIPARIRVDWRGLPMVDGIVRDSSKVDWGFGNFITFGPEWQYSAQDYAAKNHKKEQIVDRQYGTGLLFTAQMWTGHCNLNVREEFYDISTEGTAKVHVRWSIGSTEGKPMQLERAYVRFPLADSDFANGTVGDTKLPLDYENEWIGVGDKRKIHVVSSKGDKHLCMDVMTGNAVIADPRKEKNQRRFELRLEFPKCKEGATSDLEFDIWGYFDDSTKRHPQKVNLEIPPPQLKMAANADWCVFPWTNAVKPGSILDFSKLGDEAPAGALGFARVGADGHFYFEKDPEKKPRRFIGGNLNFDANFLSKEEVEKAVRDFKVRGWNTIRCHHIDVTITKDQWNNLWNRRSYPEISPTQLDKLDYLLAECKKAGIYVTFDLYAMGGLGSCEGFDKPLNSNTIKAIA